MQKSEWKNSKNWLLGNENGEKNAQVGLYPIINELDHFWTIPKWQTLKIDACGVALGIEQQQKEMKIKLSKLFYATIN